MEPLRAEAHAGALSRISPRVFFNARIRARSPEEALDVLQECFGGLVDIYPDNDANLKITDQVEEAEVHIATYNMTVEDILEEEPIE